MFSQTLQVMLMFEHHCFMKTIQGLEKTEENQCR